MRRDMSPRRASGPRRMRRRDFVRLSAASLTAVVAGRGLATAEPATAAAGGGLPPDPPPPLRGGRTRPPPPRPPCGGAGGAPPARPSPLYGVAGGDGL